MKTDPFAAVLAELCAKGSVPASRLKAKRTRIRFQTLLDSGVVVMERMGAGQRCRVRHRQGLDAFIRAQFPSGLHPPLSSSLMPRNRSVQYTKDAHGAKSSRLPVFVRGFQGARLTWDDQVLPVADLTSLAGGAGFCLDRNTRWSFSGLVVTVENSEVLFCIEKIVPMAGLAVYAGGRLSNLVLEWLGSEAMEGSLFVHSGDYDPVGLQDYLRLKEACPGRVSLYAPDNLEALFARYARQERLDDQSGVLATIRVCDDREVRNILKLMDRYNGGVDQEALLDGIDRLKG